MWVIFPEPVNVLPGYIATDLEGFEFRSFGATYRKFGTVEDVPQVSVVRATLEW